MDAKKPALCGPEVAMENVLDSAQCDGAIVKVKARPKAQRIEVCITRANWQRCFSIKIVDGVLPDQYRGDAQIEDAYKLVRVNYDKWLHR